MISYQVESFSETLEEMRPLIERHFAEIEPHLTRFTLSRDFGKYLSLEQSGMLAMVTARDSGALIGYGVFMVMPHPRFQDCLFAMNDALYLVPEQRRGWTGIRLISFAEQWLQHIGVVRLMITVTARYDFSRILKRNGFEETERNFEKQLNGRA